MKPTLPYTPGGDVAGMVETVGEGVTSVKVCVPDLFIHYSNSIVQNKVGNSIN